MPKLAWKWSYARFSAVRLFDKWGPMCACCCDVVCSCQWSQARGCLRLALGILNWTTIPLHCSVLEVFFYFFPQVLWNAAHWLEVNKNYTNKAMRCRWREVEKHKWAEWREDLLSWEEHWEQGWANKADAGQMWRGSRLGKNTRNTTGGENTEKSVRRKEKEISWHFCTLVSNSMGFWMFFFFLVYT